MNNKHYLLLLGLLAISSMACIGCEEDEEKTVPAVFENAHSFANKHSSMLNLPDVYQCITEANDQISPIELTIDTDLPDIPDELPVYRVIRPDVDEDYAVEIARKLGFTGDPEEISNRTFPHNGFSFRKEGKTLQIYQDGSIATFYVLNPDRPLSLPSDVECIEIAREWLEDHGLYPKNVIDISTSPVILYVSKGIDVQYEYTQNISVSFTIGINGYEAQGMGAYVAVGENGEILEAYINVPEFEKYTTVTLQQPETMLETFENYLDNLELFYADSPLCLLDSIRPIMSVTDISLKYFCMLSEDDNILALAQLILVLEGQTYRADYSDPSTFTSRIDAVIR